MPRLERIISSSSCRWSMSLHFIRNTLSTLSDIIMNNLLDSLLLSARLLFILLSPYSYPYALLFSAGHALTKLYSHGNYRLAVLLESRDFWQLLEGLFFLLFKGGALFFLLPLYPVAILEILSPFDTRIKACGQQVTAIANRIRFLLTFVCVVQGLLGQERGVLVVLCIQVQLLRCRFQLGSRLQSQIIDESLRIYFANRKLQRYYEWARKGLRSLFMM